jgi:hypothetical protein
LKVEQASLTYSPTIKVSTPSYINGIPNYIGCYTKGFSHIKNPSFTGTYYVDVTPYQNFLKQIQSLSLSGIASSVSNAAPCLVDPFNLVDLELNGKYAGNYHLTPSAQSILVPSSAAEMVELYEMALMRDVPFIQWSSSPTATAAASNLTTLGASFLGPKENNQVTVNTLFRGPTIGDRTGPYVSQFLYHPFTMGSKTVTQTYGYVQTGTSYLTSVTGFINVWNGNLPPSTDIIVGERYLSTLSDCGIYIHKDQPWQPFFAAHCLLQAWKVPYSFKTGVNTNVRRNTFVSLGTIDITDLMTRAYKLAMDVTWLYKYINEKLRPEEYGYQIHLCRTNQSMLPSNLKIPTSLLNNTAVNQIFNLYGTYLLPQLYPEGSPCHPSFPSGHATIAGAAVTILKAFYNCNHVFGTGTVPSLVQSNANGSSLVSYTGAVLTVGGELDKLASNCGIFRNAAGIHYRSDAQGINLGEVVACNLLHEFVDRYNGFVEFKVPLRNGTTVTINNSSSCCQCRC